VLIRVFLTFEEQKVFVLLFDYLSASLAGFWKAYPPLAKLGLAFHEMANPEWFDRDPQLAWGFYGHRLGLYRNTVPHKGFEILREIVKFKSDNYFVFTSNVDGQFQKAGFDETKIVECHGSIHFLQCTMNCSEEIWRADNVNLNVDETLRAALPLPHCSKCNSLARPNILMFSDWGWVAKRTSAQKKRYEAWLDRVKQQNAKLAILELGAGTAVPTVRHNSEFLLSVNRGKAKLLRINQRESHVSDSDGLPLPLSASLAMQLIQTQLQKL
jgi:NAD-dependent SIR2 family protein deacetylase